MEPLPQEPIEPVRPQGTLGRWLAPHRRPVALCAALALAVLLITFVSLSSPTESRIARKTQSDEPRRLKPATDKVRDLLAVGAGTADAGVGPLEIPRTEQDSQRPAKTAPNAPNEAHVGNPPAQNDAPPASRHAAVGARAEPTLEERLQKQYEDHLVAMQSARLKLRQDAVGAGTLVDSFDRVRRAEADELTNLFGDDAMGDDGAGAGTETMPGMREISKMASSAMHAMTRVGRPGGAPTNPADVLGALAGGVGGVVGGVSDADAEAVGEAHHENRLAFLKNGGAILPGGELRAKVERAALYTLPVGHEIKGMLVTKVISEGPGIIKGVISESVYDRWNNLLVPQGTEAVGTYNARVYQGNARLQVAWTTLTFPNGDTLDLGSMPGASLDGASGLRDQVDRHIAERLGAVVMSSLFTVGYEVTAPQNGSLLGSAVHRGVGENLVGLGVDIAREIGRRPPTLTLRQGTEFMIVMKQRVRFPGAYTDEVDRSTLRGAQP